MNKLIAPIVVTLVLTACGGGGGPGGAAAPATPPSTALQPVTASNGTTLITSGDNIAVMAFATGDVNGDGRDDVVVGGWTMAGAVTRIRVLTQNANGTLTDSTSTILPTTTYPGSQHIFITDLDGDGHNDIVLPGFSDGCNGAECPEPTVIFWGGSGVMTQQTFTDTSLAHGACIDDVNNDGKPDILAGGSGIYVNNGNRTFTLNSSLFVNVSTCSVAHQANGDIAILQGNNGQVPGYTSWIGVYDSNLNLVNQYGVGSRETAADLIDSVAMDVNNDGVKDFVLIFNDAANPGNPGSKEIWLGNGTGYTYASTFDTQYQNLYYYVSTTIGTTPVVYFSGPANAASLYKVINGTLAPYTTTPSIQDTNIIYQNRSTGKTYMLKSANNGMATQEIQ